LALSGRARRSAPSPVLRGPDDAPADSAVGPLLRRDEVAARGPRRPPVLLGHPGAVPVRLPVRAADHQHLAAAPAPRRGVLLVAGLFPVHHPPGVVLPRLGVGRPGVAAGAQQTAVWAARPWGRR